MSSEDISGTLLRAPITFQTTSAAIAYKFEILGHISVNSNFVTLKNIFSELRFFFINIIFEEVVDLPIECRWGLVVQCS